jgi:hypothetical protein
MVTHSSQQQLDLDANWQVIENQTDDFENGEEYGRLIETSYRNLMLERQVLKTEERPMGHMSFLPQEVVHQDVWIGGLQRRNNSRQQSPQKEM